MEEEFHNHMRIPWHDYTRKSLGHPITEASLSEKASIIGRTGIMLLSCGTGAWRVRSSMNTLARELGITFILGGDVILIENDLLADALNALPQDNRDILLMYWFLEMADREIAERMNLARRTINNRRLKSYRLLKELMGGDTDA